MLLGVKDGEAGIRLLDTPAGGAGEGDVWLPIEMIGEARLVLTDALVRAALKGAAPCRSKSRTRNEFEVNGAEADGCQCKQT